MHKMSRGKKEGILNLEKHLEKVLNVKLSGGREIEGVLKGYDTMINLVLDNAKEYLRSPEDHYMPLLLPSGEPAKRNLGRCVVRGTQVLRICPADGMEEIENPFTAAEEEVV